MVMACFALVFPLLRHVLEQRKLRRERTAPLST